MLSKYQPLVDYVAAQTENALTLTFAQIEAIIGGPLPEAMQNDGGMWKRPHHAYVQAWEAAGWTATLNRGATSASTSPATPRSRECHRDTRRATCRASTSRSSTCSRPRPAMKSH